LKEGPLSEQKKAAKSHEHAKAIGWNFSKILNKENPDNIAPEKRGGLKGTADTLGYSTIYSNFLMEGRYNI
jgi:hypothetical protein